MKIFDFEPQFLATQITKQIIWGQKVRDVGQSFWDRGSIDLCGRLGPIDKSFLNLTQVVTLSRGVCSFCGP